ncbi:acetyltransferase [Micrococcus terreus]|uniref:acetyltransferase n=1 Tax=Micrococcus terreus TaxID=574650 RepID=UPI0021A6E408|nr:acetyltransferase [Micrococcus terreus]MCT2089343.1 acetyltransferase [Micrococcus terreus]
MTQDLVIVGSGGFGREVADVVSAINAAESGPRWNLLGYLDDSPSTASIERADRQGLRVLGPVAPDTVSGSPHFVVGINNGAVRKTLAQRLESAGWKPATLIDPRASIGSDARIGEGTIMCAGARITTNVTLGRHVQLNLNCTIGHDSKLEDFVSVNPLASISGEVRVREESTVGAAAFILQGLDLAPGTTVGASACVVKGTTESCVLVGVPARTIGPRQ